MKITLTSTQVDEIRRNAQQKQNEAWATYSKARDIYNKTLEIRTGEIELDRLVELTKGLNDEPAVRADPSNRITLTTKPTAGDYRFFAYSRSGRKEDGRLATHEIVVNSINGTTCTCPGFRFNGNCWASDEAKLQFQKGTLSRPSGTNNVFRR